MADPDEPDDVEESFAESDSDVSDDVTQVMRLLSWARKQGHAIQSLQVGEVIIGGYRDTRPRFGMTPSGPQGILAEFGMKEEQ